MTRSECSCCGSTDACGLPYRDAFLGGVLRQCRGCRHVELERLPDPQVIRSYYATTYSDTRGAFTGAMYALTMKRRARAQLDFCERAAPLAGSSLLDVGCGYGALCSEARGRGARVSGLEFDPRAVEHCRRLGLDVAMVEGEEALPQRIAALRPELVAFSHCLEHLRSPLSALAACGGARVLIEVPAYDPEIAEQFDDQEGHLHFFTRTSLTRLVQRAGLDVVDLDQFGPDLDTYFRRSRRWERRARQLMHGDIFFGKYRRRAVRGMWIRALGAMRRP